MKLLLRSVAGPLVVLGLVCASPAPGEAAAILIGQTIHASLLDNGIDADPTPEDLLVVAAQREITWNNSPFGTNIGSSGLMLDGEYIDIEALSLTFRIFGGGDDYGPNALYNVTGFGPDARYVFSNLFAPGVAEIVGVQIVLTDVLGVALNSEVFFDAHSVTLRIGTLGVLETQANLGTVRLDLQVREIDQEVIPEPATLALVGTGALALVRRRRRPSVR